jgi:hypothetical protein
MSSEEEEDKVISPIPLINWRDVTIRPFTSCHHVNDRQGQIVYDALMHGKRHFGVSSASLSWMKSDKMKNKLPEGWKPEVVDVAIDAEHRTTRTIINWMKNKPAAVLIDSVHIPGVGKETVDEETGLIEGGDTDHILIIGSNIYVIDTKNWKKKSRYTIDDDGKILRNGKSFPGGKVHMDAAIKMWYKYIDANVDNGAELAGAIYIDNEDKPDPKTKEWTTSVFRDQNWYQHFWYLIEERRWIDWLDSKYVEQAGYDKDTGEIMNPEAINTIYPSLIAQVAVTCVKPYNRREGLINMAALK